MRVIEGRAAPSTDKPLRILSILRGQCDAQRAPALQALADIGHQVVYIDEILSLDDYRKLINRLDFDVAVLWGSSLQNFLMTADAPFFFDELGLPYVSLWTDNPVKHLFLLKDARTKLHKGMFVADTQVIAQLQDLGYDNVFYLPPWHIDPEIFRPVAPEAAYLCDIGFAATVNPYEAERRRWRSFWDYRMNAAADSVIAELQQCKDHVDVYDRLAPAWDVWSLAFSLISHAMYFEQKSIVREQLVDALGEREIHVVGIGTRPADRPNLMMHPGLEWDQLSRVFCSTKINLNCTPWPRSCHHRIFQATASRAFMITDYREDSVVLFEPGKEVVYFKSLEELPDLVERYLADPAAMAAIAEGATGGSSPTTRHTTAWPNSPAICISCCSRQSSKKDGARRPRW